MFGPGRGNVAVGKIRAAKKTKAAKRTKAADISVQAPVAAGGDPAIFQEAGSFGAELEFRLFRQVLDTLWLPEDMSEEDSDKRIIEAIQFLRSIKPHDGIEGLLAAQMFATHNAAMECLRRAMVSGQTYTGRDMNLKHATKLLSVFAKQMEALNRNRGKGQQKVTVEHVNVESGGQAIVGNVEQKSK